MAKRLKITDGKASAPLKKYKHVFLDQIVGKTVEAIGKKTVPSAYGDEPCVVLLFTDHTQHGFVLPVE